MGTDLTSVYEAVERDMNSTTSFHNGHTFVIHRAHERRCTFRAGQVHRRIPVTNQALSPQSAAEHLDQ